MRQLSIVLLGSAVALSFMAGCCKQDVVHDPPAESAAEAQAPQVSCAEEAPAGFMHEAPDPPKAPDGGAGGRQEREVYIFQGKYWRAKGPCIRIGNGWAMPVLDAFEVMKVVSGDLKAKSITVRVHFDCGPGYPKNLTEENVYTLRLTPSERTKQQLREIEAGGLPYIAVNAEEIEELPTKEGL